MKKSLFFILAGAAVSALLASCAVAPVDDSVTQQKSVRDAWVRVNYGTDYVALTESGIYILEETPGTGPAVKDSTYCFVSSVDRLSTTMISNSSLFFGCGCTMIGSINPYKRMLSTRFRKLSSSRNANGDSGIGTIRSIL